MNGVEVPMGLSHRIRGLIWGREHQFRSLEMDRMGTRLLSRFLFRTFIVSFTTRRFGHADVHY